MARWSLHRELNDGMLPLPYPRMPDYLSPPESTTPEKFHAEMDAFEADARRVQEENDRRLQKAMPWIKQCAMLHGLSHSFDLSGRVRPITHRSWCPAPYWLHALSNSDPMKWKWPRG